MVVASRDRSGSVSSLMGKEKPVWSPFVNKWSLLDAWEARPWCYLSGHTYFSLQYPNSSSRLDRGYFSHAGDWFPHSLSVKVDYFSPLSDYLPFLLSWDSPSSLFPKGFKRDLIFNSLVCKVEIFNRKTLCAIACLDNKVQKGSIFARFDFAREMQRIIRDVGKRIAANSRTVVFGASQLDVVFQSKISTHALSSSEHEEWLQAKQILLAKKAEEANRP